MRKSGDESRLHNIEKYSPVLKMTLLPYYTHLPGHFGLMNKRVREVHLFTKHFVDRRWQDDIVKQAGLAQFIDELLGHVDGKPRIVRRCKELFPRTACSMRLDQRCWSNVAEEDVCSNAEVQVTCGEAQEDLIASCNGRLTVEEETFACFIRGTSMAGRLQFLTTSCHAGL